MVNRDVFALPTLTLVALAACSSSCGSTSSSLFETPSNASANGGNGNDGGGSGNAAGIGGSGPAALGGNSSGAATSGGAAGNGTQGGSDGAQDSAGMGGLGAAGSGGSEGGAPNLLVPASGALFGAFAGSDANSVSNLEAILGRKLAIHLNFFGWTDDYSGQLAQDFSAGHVPFITWEAWKNNTGTPLDQIISGAFDSLLHQNAAAVKAFNKPFFLRWAHEMNGNWYPWAGAMNGADANASAKYIAAYRHIHDVFIADGASKVVWVFCPNVDSVPSEAWNDWTNYYPGDDYVDWMCADGYNWGTTNQSSWQSFETIFSRIYPGLAAKNKPILIGETASTEQGGDKAQWISAVVPALKESFPAVKALVWFNMNKETNWPLDSSSASKSAAVAMVNDPYFNP